MVYEVYERKWRLWLVLGICIAFVGIGVWLAWVSVDNQTDSYIAIAIFGIFGIAVLRRLAAPKPMLVVSDSGIADQRWLAAGLIPWGDIAAVGPGPGLLHRTLNITLKDRARFLARRSGGTILWWRVNNLISGDNYRLSLKGLSVTASELVERANRQSQQRRT
jgi:hypothetical protein